LIYLDTGCLLKLYYPEPESESVAKLVAEQAIVLVALRLLDPFGGAQYPREIVGVKPQVALPPKLSMPALSGVMARNRLFGELDRTPTGGLTWLHAPAGSGKTSLVASYLEGRDVLWYDVDAADRDVAACKEPIALLAFRGAELIVDSRTSNWFLYELRIS
jgi:hypothetical protein